MSPQKLRFLEDKAMRDAARLNVMTDVELIKADIEEEGPGKRLAETGADYARILADGAMDVVQENKGRAAGAAALGIAAVAAWIFRDEIAELIGSFLHDDEQGDPEPGASPDVSQITPEHTLSGAD